MEEMQLLKDAIFNFKTSVYFRRVYIIKTLILCAGGPCHPSGVVTLVGCHHTWGDPSKGTLFQELMRGVACVQCVTYANWISFPDCDSGSCREWMKWQELTQLTHAQVLAQVDVKKHRGWHKPVNRTYWGCQITQIVPPTTYGFQSKHQFISSCKNISQFHIYIYIYIYIHNYIYIIFIYIIYNI